MHPAGGRIILDQFDTARSGTPPCRATSQRSCRRRNPCPGPARLRGGDQSLPVAAPVLPAEHEILAAARNAFCSTSGLVAAKLDGAIMSSTCRTENSTIASLAAPRRATPVVALCHHCSLSRNACANRLNGGLCHSGPAKRRSCGCGLIRDHGPCCEESQCSAVSKNLFRVPQAVLGYLHLPLRRRRQMRGPIDIGKRQRHRRYARRSAAPAWRGTRDRPDMARPAGLRPLTASCRIDRQPPRASP